jgi:Fur family ferric uptake transcriptional regulator
MNRTANKTRVLGSEELRQLLIGKGLRVTAQRTAVLLELAKAKLPISHPELTERLASQGLERTTVYRNLVSLTEAGLLVKTQLGDSVWRFGLPNVNSAGHGVHPHFVCNDCGDVSCLPESSVALRGEAIRNHHVAEVQLRGRCAACVRI